MSEASVPPERDTKDFKFQQLCKVRVCNSPASLPTNRSSLIIASSKYDLTFVGVDKGFKVLRTSDFVKKDLEHITDRLQYVVTDLNEIANVNVGQLVTHVTLSADELTLAVAAFTGQTAAVYLYVVRNFAVQVREPVYPYHTIQGEGDEPLYDVVWNPVDPNLYIIVYSTGRLDIYHDIIRRSSLSSARAKAACWSPKGKQLVIGRQDGTLMQYDFDLNEKKRWECPNVFSNASFEVLDLTWISTYSFFVAYVETDSDQSEQPQIVLINGSKEGAVTYTKFEDPCFGTGEDRNRKYHFMNIQRWEMILTASSNASEIGVVGKHLDDKERWMRWNLDDTSRAESPLTDDYNDTFPMGVTIDYSSQTQIPLGDEKFHPASPIMMILSTEGLIIPYHMMYIRNEIPSLNIKSQVLSTAGLKKGTDPPIIQSTAPPSGPLSAPPSALPTAQSTSQPAAVKNLFGVGAGGKSSSGSIFGSSTGPGSTSTPGSMFSLTPVSQAPATGNLFENSGAKPKVPGFSVTSSTPGSGFNFCSSADQSGTKPLFCVGSIFTSKSDQSENKASIGSTVNAPSSTTVTTTTGKPIFGTGLTTLKSTENKSGFGSGFGGFAQPVPPSTASSAAFSGSSFGGFAKREDTDNKPPSSAGFTTTTFGDTSKPGGSTFPSFGAPSTTVGQKTTSPNNLETGGGPLTKQLSPVTDAVMSVVGKNSICINGISGGVDTTRMMLDMSSVPEKLTYSVSEDVVQE